MPRKRTWFVSLYLVQWRSSNHQITQERKNKKKNQNLRWFRNRTSEIINRRWKKMAGQSRKWMILVATIWIQAFTGTNFDFSTYSSNLKSVLGISQVQLNYLAVASDLGKVFGWSSGLALLYFPLWTVLFAAAIMGFVGYGVQWLAITNVISLPYILVKNFSTFSLSVLL